MADLDAIERALCERYNIPSLDGVLADALAQARSGDEVQLRALLAAREMYGWRETIWAALDARGEPEAEEAEAEPEVVADSVTESDEVIVTMTAETTLTTPPDVTEEEAPKAAPRSRRGGRTAG